MINNFLFRKLEFKFITLLTNNFLLLKLFIIKGGFFVVKQHILS